MKQLIRLTESALHNLIAEAAQEILSELDWRTYANAAQKSYQKAKEYDTKRNQKKWYDNFFGIGKRRNDKYLNKYHKERARAQSFNQAAQNAIQQQLGYKNKNGFTFAPSVGASEDGDRINLHTYAGKNNTVHSTNYYDNRAFDTKNGETYNLSADNATPNYKQTKKWTDDRIKTDPNNPNKKFWDNDLQKAKRNMVTPYEKRKMNRGINTIRNFAQNKSYYKDGQWHEGE